MFRERSDWGGVQVLCPNGHDTVHHSRIDVWERGEDETRGLHVSVGEDGVHVDPKADVEHRQGQAGNPSPRRHGLTVWFWCEQCGKDNAFGLDLSQHKGETFLAYHPEEWS